MKLQKPSVYSRICLVRFMAITVPKHLPPQTTDFHIFTPCRIGFLSKIELFANIRETCTRKILSFYSSKLRTLRHIFKKYK